MRPKQIPSVPQTFEWRRREVHPTNGQAVQNVHVQNPPACHF